MDTHLREAATVFDVTDDGVLILSADFHILAANPSFCRMTGFSDENIVGTQPTMLGDFLQKEQHLAALAATGRWRSETQVQTSQGEQLPVSVTLAAVKDAAGAIVHHVILMSDLSAIRAAQSNLERLAHYDALTGLPNRLLALDRLRHAIERCGRQRMQIGLLFIDLDRFKAVNDTLGHSAGDELLRTMAERMRSAVRAQDTVARLGGDEFMVILEHVSHPADVAHAAGKILAAVAPPIDLGRRQMSVTASIGISLFPGDAATHDALIKAADTALYVAKERGRNKYAFFANEMTADAAAYVTQEQDLRRGLAANEFVVHYQPQFCARTKALVGAEALIHWRHPQKGLLSAGDFVPVAEKNGLIADIGDWHLSRACEQLQAWQTVQPPNFRMAVNVSAHQIRHGRLLTSIQRILAAAPWAASRIELEVAESSLQEEDDCVAFLRALSRLGVTVAVDSFGTGYSCLAILQSLPIQRLKIDRRFIANLFGGDGAPVAEVIIAVARRLNLAALADGVETLEEESFLRGRGCHELQGNLYGKPVPAEEFVEHFK